MLKWNGLAGHPAPPTDGLVAVLRGYRAHLARTRSAKAAPRRATPPPPPALRAMLAGLDRGTPAGRRDAAILLLGFAVAARRGELAGLDASREADRPRHNGSASGGPPLQRETAGHHEPPERFMTKVAPDNTPGDSESAALTSRSNTARLAVLRLSHSAGPALAVVLAWLLRR